MTDRSHYPPAPWSAREIEAQAWALERARRTGADTPEMPSPYDLEGRARWVWNQEERCGTMAI